MNPLVLKRLQCSIKSLNNQTFKKFGVCIVDLSPQTIKPNIDKILKGYKYLHVPQDKFVHSYGINIGIKHLTTAQYVKLSDADIVYEKNHFKSCMDVMVKRKLDFLTTLTLYTENNQYVYHSDYDVLYRSSEKKRMGAAPGCPLLKRDLVFDLNGYDETFTSSFKQDTQFFMRARRAEGKLVLADWPDAKSTHLWHERNPFMWNKDTYREEMVAWNKKKMNLTNINPNGWGIIHE